jgi:DNA repair protein RadC
MQRQLFTKVGRRYKPAPAETVCEAAAAYLAAPLMRGPAIVNPRVTREYLRTLLGMREREGFAVVFLDNRHRVIATEVMFEGTIDGASVHPREVVKAALRQNAAAIILAHNHPSGNPEPSAADELITQRLRDALALVDIRVLDHLIVAPGGFAVSFAERGLI